ncbi:MAG: queuosine precursor transporter [bacterium]
MFNELLFFFQIAVIGFFTLFFLFVSKEALITFICLQSVLANLFVIKQISLFGLTVTCTDVFIIGAVLGTNLLQEYYGKEIAKKTVYLNLLILLFYLVASQIHVLYQPSSLDFVHNSYAQILQFMPRIIFASVFTFFVVQRLDVFVYGFLKSFFNDKYLWARNVSALILSQIIDTALFSFLGLYGIVASLFDVMFLSLIVKVSIIFLSSPVVILSKKLINKLRKPC